MSARKHNAETQYIYSKKITSALKWSQKETKEILPRLGRACARVDFLGFHTFSLLKQPSSRVSLGLVLG